MPRQRGSRHGVNRWDWHGEPTGDAATLFEVVFLYKYVETWVKKEARRRGGL
jgi:hypothetical protein